MKIIQVLFIALFITSCFSFYLPGVAPREYHVGDPVPLKVNKITSVDTQIPYAYYDLPFCKPAKIRDAIENLGEILMGDKIENSDYLIEAKVNKECKVLCKRSYNEEEITLFKKRIEQNYRVHWLIDGLPAATKKFMHDSIGREIISYEDGFPLGVEGSRIERGVPGQFYLNNHVHIILFYHYEHVGEKNPMRIVGFEIEPMSVDHDVDYQEGSLPRTCPIVDSNPLLVHHKTDFTVVWTYSVDWKQSDVKWALRWDVYLKMKDTQIHWFSIINSLMIVLFLSGMVAMIIMRTVHADFRKYRELETQEEAQEETGWKLVHGDVFRPPSHGNLLSALVGTGVQVWSMIVITMVFAVLGFLSPANRGGLLTAMILLYVFMGVFNGYFSARFYKFFNGEDWKSNFLTSGLLFPGVTFGIFFFLNFFLIGKHSSGGVHFGTLLGIATIWFGISLPLVFLGSYFGNKKQKIEVPVRTNQIPRQVPDQIWYMKPVVSILMGGILPFGAIFIELFFIMSSIWLHQFYYLFGFLFMVLVILIITCAEITIVMCYFQLCTEDYHWWWRSFLTSGSSALYVFISCIFYYFSRLHIKSGVSTILYFGYSLIFSVFFFVFTGAIGFISCFVFVNIIYANVKVD